MALVILWLESNGNSDFVKNDLDIHLFILCLQNLPVSYK